MLTEYEILNNCYQKSPKNIEHDKKYELSQRNDLKKDNQKRSVLTEKDMYLYKHNNNEIKTQEKAIMTVRIDFEETENRCIAMGLSRPVKLDSKKLVPNLGGNILGKNHKTDDNLYINNLYMAKGV